MNPNNPMPRSQSSSATILRDKRRRVGLRTVLLAAFASASTAHAVDSFWDPALTTTTTGTGAGGGTWSTTNVNWVTTGGTNVTLPSVNRAVFGGAGGGVVTVGSNVAAAGMLFNTTGYSLSADSARTLSSSAGVSLASGVTATIGSNVTVSRGTVDTITTLSGAGGTLNIGSADQTSTGAKYINTQSGSTGSTRIITISGATTVNVNSGGYLGQNPATVYNTAVNPNGTAIIVGNSATGGSLVVKDGGNVTVGNNTVMILGGGTTANGSLTIDGGQVNAGGVTIGVNGLLPAQALYAGLRFGSGNQTSGTRTASLNGGTLTVGQVYVSGTVGASTNTFNFNGGTLQAAINNTTFMTGLTTANVQAGGAKIDTNSFDVSIGQALIHDVALGVTADGGLTKSGVGALTLTGVNTYDGTTTIKNGSLVLNGATRILSTSAVVLGDTGTTGKLVLGASSVGTQTLTSLTTAGSGGSVVGGNAANSTLTLSIASANDFSGTLGGGGTNENNLAVTKSDVGTLTLSGNNSYSGVTTVSAGILNIQSANALGSTAGNTTVAGAASLQLQGGLVFAAEPLALTANSSSTQNLRNVSGDNEWTGTITHANVSTANSVNIGSDDGLLTLSNTLSGAGAPFLFRGDGDIAVSGQITGASGVISGSIGSGTRTLSNTANDYTGLTTVSGGALSFSSIGNVAGGASALGAPVDATNGTIAVGALTTSGVLVYTGTGNTSDRVIDLKGTSGGTTIDQSGASGLLKFTSDFTATGLGDKTLTLQGSTGGAGEVAGAIVDSTGFTTSLTKSGSGTWTLSGTNTYTGATTVSQGTLVVSGSIASSVTTISPGAVLSFTGSSSAGNITVGAGASFALGTAGTAGAVTINGGTFSGSGTVNSLTFTGTSVFGPGNSPGTVTIADGGTLTMSSATVSNFEITSASFNLGSHDLVQGTAGGAAESVVFGGTLNLLFSNGPYSVGATAVRIFNVDGYSGSFSSVNFSGLAVGQVATFDSLTGFVSISAVPEPASFAALAGFGAVGATLFRRRHQAKAKRSA